MRAGGTTWRPLDPGLGHGVTTGRPSGCTSAWDWRADHQEDLLFLSLCGRAIRFVESISNSPPTHRRRNRSYLGRRGLTAARRALTAFPDGTVAMVEGMGVKRAQHDPVAQAVQVDRADGLVWGVEYVRKCLGPGRRLCVVA